MATIVDPELIANIVQQLNVKGALAPFDISEIAFPVFDIGRLAGLTGIQKVATPGSETAVRVGTAAGAHLVVSETPADPGDFTNSSDASPVAGTVLADTGALAAGLYLINAELAYNGAALESIQFEWRNAANAATLAYWQLFPRVDQDRHKITPFIADLSANERLRWLTIVNTTAATVETTVRATPVARSTA